MNNDTPRTAKALPTFMIDTMVSRLLCWKLPKDFAPDAGIRFLPNPMQQHGGPYWPTGTNLMHAEQAREMIEHMLVGAINPAVLDVLTERRRQVEAEGWTPDHDDEHAPGEMSQAAACYAKYGDWAAYRNTAPNDWPWHESWWKPSDSRRNLVKAAALILAEIERLDRIESPKGKD